MSLIAGSYLGSYHILEQTGHARMAAEYRAQKAGQPGYVAIKVVPAWFAQDAGYNGRYQEAMRLRQLTNPNILTVLDYGEEHRVAYLVTAYLGGTSLAERTGRPAPVDEVVRLLRPVADALDYAHRQGVLHRDVKPANILVAPDGRTVLGDFGLASIVDAARRVSETGEVIGSPAYMSPEQAGKKQVTEKTDQYAVAVIAFELLTGRVPFTGASPREWLMAHLHQAAPRPRDLNPALGQSTEAALSKGLAKQPEDRYPTVSAFVDALLGVDQTPARQFGPPTAVEMPLPRSTPKVAAIPAENDVRRREVIGAAILVPLAGAVLAGAIIFGLRTQSPRTTDVPATVTRVPVATAAATVLPATAAVAASASTPAAVCQFDPGFRGLVDALSEQVGACIDTASFNPATGDLVQHTAHGLLTKRTVDASIAFTDGYQSWVLGPDHQPHHRLNTERFPWEANPEGLPIAK